MKIIKAYTEILDPPVHGRIDELYQKIEKAGRTCYKSEDRITPESARKFVAGLIKRGHEAMIEHASMTVRFVVDRGVSHEIVRHRLASFAQESTRYNNYSKEKYGSELTFIKPCFWTEEYPSNTWHLMNDWKMAMEDAEKRYFSLLNSGATPEQARSVLSNSLKTEIVVTMNMREWRHFFKLRAAGVTGAPHPQMLEVAVPLLQRCQMLMPELFGDIVIPEEYRERYGV